MDLNDRRLELRKRPIRFGADVARVAVLPENYGFSAQNPAKEARE